MHKLSLMETRNLYLCDQGEHFCYFSKKTHPASQRVVLNIQKSTSQIWFFFYICKSFLLFQICQSPPDDPSGPGNHHLSFRRTLHFEDTHLAQRDQWAAACTHKQPVCPPHQSCPVKLHAQQFYEQSWTSQVLEVGLCNYKIIHLIYISKYSKQSIIRTEYNVLLFTAFLFLLPQSYKMSF